MEYKMQLTEEQKKILDGERGEVMAKVMKTLVLFGDVFGAEKLVPVTLRRDTWSRASASDCSNRFSGLWTSLSPRV